MSQRLHGSHAGVHPFGPHVFLGLVTELAEAVQRREVVVRVGGGVGEEAETDGEDGVVQHGRVVSRPCSG
jgi:hypothetical protein